MFKKIRDSLFMWLFTIAMAINVAIASINIVNMYTKNNTLVYAGRFIESIEIELERQGSLVYQTDKYKLFVMTNEWYDENFRLED